MPKRLTMEEIKDCLYEAIAGGANFGNDIKTVSGYHGDRYKEALSQLVQEKKILCKQYTRTVYGYYLPGQRAPIYDTAPKNKPKQGEIGRRLAQACVTTYGSPVVTYKMQDGKLPEWDCVKRGRSA